MILSFFPTAEGFYDYENFRYIYQYKDHLGNVRVSYVKDGSSLKGMDTNDYYPFGMSFIKSTEIAVYDPLSIPYNYKYNGKELQETGMYDYGARMYMPDIGRWGVIDAFSEKYPDLSGYSTVANDPVNAVDIDGNDFVYINEDGTIRKLVKNSSPYITVIYQGKGILLSDLDTSTNWFGYGNERNRQAIANIAGYYGRNYAGINSGTIGYDGNDDEAYAHTTQEDDIRVLSGTNNKLDPTLNNKYNFTSVLEHGKFHQKESKKLRSNYNYSSHAKVYLLQMRSKNFKKTSAKFQMGTIFNFLRYLQKAKNEGEENYQDVLEDFNNSNIGGLTIINRDSGGLYFMNENNQPLEPPFDPKPLTDPH